MSDGYNVPKGNRVLRYTEHRDVSWLGEEMWVLKIILVPLCSLPWSLLISHSRNSLCDPQGVDPQ